MADDAPIEIPEITPFDASKKKKKKKVVVQDPAEEVDKLVEKTEDMSVADVEPSFVGLKKKKKKQVDPDFVENENGARDEYGSENQPGDDEEDENIPRENAQYPWEGTTRDYHYEELLGRVFNFLHENNPDLAGDRRKTIIYPPPHVRREGIKKTVFSNFMWLCRMMHRQPEHVQNFLLTELGTSGNLDGRNRLIVKGRFAAKNFASILRKYLNEYVVCNGCKSPDTLLAKENRLIFLRCEQCGSSRSVEPIKTGFRARVVGRRD